MPIWLALVLALGALSLWMAGLVFTVLGRRGATSSEPLRVTFDCRRWKPAWCMRSEFRTESAFRFYMWGAMCWSLAGLFGVIYLTAMVLTD